MVPNCDYSFQKCYELVAHTPIIHFQHNQAGATLRATEVKPKLDSFLESKLEHIPDNWRVGETDALNYKLHFRTRGERKIVELKRKTPYDIYYGNMGENTTEKKGIISHLTMTVVCTVSTLQEHIDKHIAEFFVVHNFGSMQSKGFGSFTVAGIDYTPKMIGDCLKGFYKAEKCYTWKCNKNDSFRLIKTIYSIMKSGVNLQDMYKRNGWDKEFDGYQRSLLFLFMHDKEIGNEKAWLKQNGAPTNVGDHCTQWHKSPDNHEMHYVRALLGVGDHIDFKKAGGGREVYKISDSQKNIERLASPILFKIIDGNVYFVAKRLCSKIYDAKFKFEKQTNPYTSQFVGELPVPGPDVLGEDFIDRFLEYCKKELNNGALSKFKDTRGIKIEEV